MKLVLLAFCLASFVAACRDEAAVKELSARSPGSPCSDSSAAETFAITYPAWEQAPSDGPNVIVSQKNGPCSFQLHRVTLPPVLYMQAVEEFVRQKGFIVVSRDPLIYEISAEGHTFLAKTKAIFCEDQTYLAVFTCLEDSYDEQTMDKLYSCINTIL